MSGWRWPAGAALALTLSVLATDARADLPPQVPFDCSWQDIQPDGETVIVGADVVLDRPWLQLRLRQGAFHPLVACGHVVGFVWHGEGEVDVVDPGPARGFLLDQLFVGAVGTSRVDAAIIVASDGAVAEILLQLREQRARWEAGALPADVREAVRIRLAALEPEKAKGGRLPGEIIYAPDADLGGLFADLMMPELHRTDRIVLQDLAPGWLTHVWTPSGGRSGGEVRPANPERDADAPYHILEPGLWLTRSLDRFEERVLAVLPHEPPGPEGDPYIWSRPERRFDLLAATVHVFFRPTYAVERDLRDIELRATLELEALSNAERFLSLRLAEGGNRRVGTRWEPLEVRSVQIDGVEAVFDRVGSRLFVHLAQPTTEGHRFEVEVEYDGALVEADEGTAITPLAGWDWYPRTDGQDRHRFTSVVVVPAVWQVAATGRRIEELVDGGGRAVTSRTARSVEAGAVFVVDAEPEELRPSRPGAPVLHILRYPDTRRREAKVGEQLQEAIALLESTLGPFPYRELEIVERGTAGGWSGLPGVIAFPSFNDPPNQIATTKVGSGSLLRALVQQYVVADMGGESYHDQWLTDGLTDLAECTVLEQIGLERRCVRLLRRKRVDWMQLLDRSPDELVVGPLWLGERAGVAESARLRGPLLMHRLRVLVGDDDVRILVARVMTAYRGQRLSTRSFLMQAESLLGSDLRPFFLGWVYDTPLDPVVRVETNLVAEDDGTWTLEVSGRLDAQEGRRFRLVAPVTLSMRVDGELLLHSLTVTSRSHTTRIEGLPSIPRRIELDPARTFPGRTSLEKAAR